MSLAPNSFFSIVFLFAVSTVCAQPDSARYKAKPVYFNQFLSGGLLAKHPNPPTLQLSMLHGVRYKGISMGVGLGYDVYRQWQTLPVWAAVSGDLVRVGSNALILQLSAGGGKVWRSAMDSDGFSYKATSNKTFAAAIGYCVASGPWRLYLLAGYKFQRIRYDQTPRWGWEPTQPLKVAHDMERMTVLLGFGYR